MPLEIHAVMQNPHNKKLILSKCIKDNMHLLADPAQSGGDFFGSAAKLRIGEQGAEAGVDLVAVAAGLIDAELGDGVVGYFDQIAGTAVQPFGDRRPQGHQPALLRLVALDQIADIFAVVGIFAAGNPGFDPGVLALAQDDGFADGGHRAHSLRLDCHIIDVV